MLLVCPLSHDPGNQTIASMATGAGQQAVKRNISAQQEWNKGHRVDNELTNRLITNLRQSKQ